MMERKSVQEKESERERARAVKERATERARGDERDT